MFFFERFKRRSAIKSYARKLGPLLQKRYGKSKTYTGAQVRKTVEAGRFDADYICYAYAIFMDRPAFDQLHSEMGQSCDYPEMRQEVAGLCFVGDADFTTADATSPGGNPSASQAGILDIITGGPD